MSGRSSAVGGRRPLAFTAGGSILPSTRRAAFLDRDGVLNEGVRDPGSGQLESPLAPKDVRLRAGAAAALGELRKSGYALVCVSNQPAAAKGKITVSQVLAVHDRVLELLAHEGISLDAWRLCPHHPDGVVAELSGPCECRKPAPGMLLDAACSLGLDLASCWMIGDTDADVAAGQAAGCRTLLIEYPGSAHKRTAGASPDLRVADPSDAAKRLLDHHTR